MVRGTHTRKRSRNTPYTRVNKRRRVNKRYVKRSSAFTSQSGTGGGLNFKSKKLSVKRYRRMLWNDTLMSTHYRSNLGSQIVINTPANNVNAATFQIPALRPAGSQFYIAAGGAIAPDAAQPLPLFTGNLVVRGGIIGIRLCNTLDALATAQNSLEGIVYLIKTTKNYTPASLPNPVQIGFDTSLIQDFSTLIGKIVYKKQFLLRESDSAQCEYRMKIRRLDIGDYVNDRNQYVWIVVVSNLDNVTSRSMSLSMYHNISFSGNAV